MTGMRMRETLAGVRAPTLVVDIERASSNLDRMIRRTRGWGVRFRPHFKTHQSADVAALFRERGVSMCTVSSVRMANYFAEHGWDDITLAVPLNLRELEEIRALTNRRVSSRDSQAGARIRLGLLVDSTEAAAPLVAGELPGVNVWVKVDCGYGRSGVRWDDASTLMDVAGAIAAADSVTLAGVLTHEGRTYEATSAGDVRRVHAESLRRMTEARNAVLAPGPTTAPLELSIGDTPSASLAETMDGVDEIRPGNFIFYDLMQLDIGSCGERDLAVAVACPVIGRYPERGEVVVYGGAAHLSTVSRTDSQPPSEPGSGPLRAPSRPNGEVTCGCLVESDESGLGRLRLDAPVVRLSQEHGVVRTPADVMERVAVGDILLVSPVHSCLTCAVHDHYLALDGRRLAKM